MSSHSEFPAVREWVQRVGTELLPAISRATVPIFGVSEDERFVQDRTGVLLQIGDSHFLLTASHHLRALIVHPVPLGISPSRRGDAPVHLLHSTFHCIDELDVDVAVVRLSDDAVQALLPQRRFLRLNEVDRSPTCGDGIYLVFGYPLEWFNCEQGVISSAPMSFLGRPYTGDLNPVSETHADVHIVLSYERPGINLVNGVPATLPAVGGMSGCGIWKLTDWNGRAIRNWTPNTSRLVAIQHSWDEGRNYIKGTWLRHALGLIHEHYPNLRPSLSIVY